MSFTLRCAASATVIMLAMAGSAQAQSGQFAIGGQIGTPGIGIQAQYALNDVVVLRAGYDVLSWDRDDTYDGIEYSSEVDFQSPGAFVDLHPFRNAFLVSAGAYFGDRSVDLDGTPNENVSIGSQTFTPAQVGQLTGKIELESTAPFVSLGFDNTFTRDARWGFRVLAGAAFGDEPQVSLDATGGTLSNDATFQARLAEEEAEIQAEADDYKVLPVLQIGLNYRF